MRRRLIVNADDYGLTAGVSRGIREAHLGGIVSSTTAMMNMTGVELEIQEALRKTPKLGVGVHLNLTKGRPVSRTNLVPSLVDEEGRFWTLEEFTTRLDIINLDEVHLELRTQAEVFMELTGRAPTHFDSHHHSSYFTPELFQIMAGLGQEYHCGIRNIFTPVGDMDYSFIPHGRLPEMRICTHAAARKGMIKAPDAFAGSFFGLGVKRELLLALLKGLREGVTEIMCHAGHSDVLLKESSSYNTEREGELKLLTDPEVLATVQSENIDLIPFSALQGFLKV